METLDHRDWLKLHEVLVDLHATERLADLPARIISGVQYLFPFEAGNVQDDRGGLRQIPWLFQDEDWEPRQTAGAPVTGVRMMVRRNPSFMVLREAFFVVSAEKHPHTAYFRSTKDGGARRLSELMPTGKLRQTMFYNEISRPERVNWQLTIYIRLGFANTLTIAACRQDPDFSDRERTLLDLMRPHVATAWKRAARLEERTNRMSPERASSLTALGQFGLTPREAEVLAWISEGKTNWEIAVLIGTRAATVKTHVEHILRKLNCETRTAAARVALTAPR